MRNIDQEPRGRSVAASILMIVTCLVLGLLAGGMLVIGVSLVSFWKSLSSSEFQAWFASHSHLIGRLMIPLGVGGIVVTVAAVVACWRSSAMDRRWLLIATISVMGVIVTYPLFFEATNEAFVRGGLSNSAARSLLDRWATWHWIRTALGAFGFVAALRALHG
jgi:Anthrone oxygenase